jgi:NCS1 family nucleobase:cation symporter-1
MICDYYLNRKGYLQVKDLYSASRDGPYYFVFGFSWHAYASYLSGILVNIVGFAGAVGRTVPVGAQYIYNVNYFSGFFVSAVMYYILTRVFPLPASSDRWNEVDSDDEVAYGQEVDSDDMHMPGDVSSLDKDSESDRKGAKIASGAMV